MRGTAIGLMWVATIGLATGCARLKVDVHILDPLCLSDGKIERQAEAAAGKILADRESGQFGAIPDRLQWRARKLRDDLDATLNALGPNVFATGERAVFIDRTLAPLDEVTIAERDTALARANDFYDRGLELIYRARRSKTADRRRGLYSEALATFRQGDAEIDALAREAQAAVDDVRRSIETYLETRALQVWGDADAAAALRAADATMQDSLDTKADMSEEARKAHAVQLATDFTGDSRAPIAAHAPESCWSRGLYNRAYGKGVIGNTDIAIKMDGPANFTVKGLRMNADKVTVATFRAGMRLASLAAAAYGVPVPTGSTTTADTTSAAEAADPAEASAAANMRARTLRRAIGALLDAIAAQHARLAADDQRASAIAAVKAGLATFADQVAAEASAGGGAIAVPDPDEPLSNPDEPAAEPTEEEDE